MRHYEPTAVGTASRCQGFRASSHYHGISCSLRLTLTSRYWSYLIDVCHGRCYSHDARSHKTPTHLSLHQTLPEQGCCTHPGRRSQHITARLQMIKKIRIMRHKGTIFLVTQTAHLIQL